MMSNYGKRLNRTTDRESDPIEVVNLARDTLCKSVLQYLLGSDVQ